MTLAGGSLLCFQKPERPFLRLLPVQLFHLGLCPWRDGGPCRCPARGCPVVPPLKRSWAPFCSIGLSALVPAHPVFGTGHCFGYFGSPSSRPNVRISLSVPCTSCWGHRDGLGSVDQGEVGHLDVLVQQGTQDRPIHSRPSVSSPAVSVISSVHILRFLCHSYSRAGYSFRCRRTWNAGPDSWMACG